MIKESDIAADAVSQIRDSASAAISNCCITGAVRCRLRQCEKTTREPWGANFVGVIGLAVADSGAVRCRLRRCDWARRGRRGVDSVDIVGGVDSVGVVDESTMRLS